MTASRAALLLMLLCLAPGCDCGAGGGPDAGPCVADGGVILTVTTPATFACHQHYTASFEVVNQNCSPVTVSGLRITQTRTSGVCTPGPIVSTYLPTTATVPSGAQVAVLTLTAGAFCCSGAGCPADYVCGYRFDFQADTSVGPLADSASGLLSLASCTERCP